MDESKNNLAPGENPPLWKSKSLLVAVALTCLGLFLWHPWAAGPAPQRNLPAGVSSFSESPTAGSTVETPATSASPALFRFGASYVAGFFLGWFCRKSLKVALLLGGAAAIVLFFLQRTGKIDLEWSAIQAHLSQSLAWLHGELGALKHLVTGYLPSTGAALVGIFMGARHG